MKLSIVIGVVCAVFLHAGVICFGGILFPRDETQGRVIKDVELLSAEEAAEKEKPKEQVTEEKKEEIETEAEAPPDAAEIVKSLDVAPANDAPALEAASLSSIESALEGHGGGGGDFGEAMSFTSGGRIGGLGKAGISDAKLESAFDITEIDQKPRAVFQSAPNYPADMRGKKLEGSVTVIFVVDPAGKVAEPRVESSTNPAFDRPALEAVRRWKFEPALKGGQRVPCKMRIPIRFQPS